MAVYVRVEAMNFDWFIEDTTKLGVIRGGSYLLLEAALALEPKAESESEVKAWCNGKNGRPAWPSGVKLESIRAGASVGFFEAVPAAANGSEVPKDEVGCEASATGDANPLPPWAPQLLACVRAYLGGHEEFRHATFVVDLVGAQAGTDGKVGKDEFLLASEALVAANRWQQWQAPTVTVPSLERIDGASAEAGARSPAGGLVACEIDRVRPRGRIEPDRRNRLGLFSASTRTRMQKGKDRKFDNYLKVVEGAARPELPPCWDFKQLTTKGRYPRLEGKMALLYVDGNDFGLTQQRLIRNDSNPRAKMKALDQQLLGPRRAFLGQLLADASDVDDASEAARDWIYRGQAPENVRDLIGLGDQFSRLEILEWGGDEFLFVVPAWLGWKVAARFFDAAKQWPPLEKGGKLTHAAGLVFCSHKAPIFRVRDVAAKLTRLAKVDRSKSLLAYEVFESFDYVVGDVGKYRDHRLPRGVASEALLFDGETMTRIEELWAELRKEKLPASGLHRLARCLHRTPADFEDLRERFVGDLPEVKTALEELAGHLGGQRALYLHLAALWDYVAPVRNEDKAATAEPGGGETC